MEIGFTLIIMTMCTVFQMWRVLRALFDLVFGYGRNLEEYDAYDIIEQVFYICAVSIAVYFLIQFATKGAV